MTPIAIIGSGAVGLFYGAQLVLAGHDVRFLLRRDYAAISERGIVIQSQGSREVSLISAPRTHIPSFRFRACRSLCELTSGTAPQWVLLAVKTTSLDGIQPLLDALATQHPAARVVVMCNGIGVEEQLARSLNPASIYAALAHVCLNRREDGSVDHLAHGKLLLGHFGDDPALLQDLSTLISTAGIASYQVGSLREARYRKLVWNLPFNGLSVAMGVSGLDTQAMMASQGSRELLRALMLEVIALANADLARTPGRGLIETSWSDEMIARTEVMGEYLTSTLLDYRAGRPLEVVSMFAEPVARARVLGVAVPRMEMLLELVRRRDGTTPPALTA